MVKKIRCVNGNCKEVIEVPDDYEPVFCCNGHMCGCYGYPINPMFCDECELKIYGTSVETK